VIVLIENGAVLDTLTHSIGQPVNASPVFQIASVSKWVTAIGVMALAEDGSIDLDATVARYLKRWSLPPGRYDERDVTIRRLPGHTAGLTDGLGYMGFSTDEARQSLPESLTRATDAMPGAPGRVEVGKRPGGQFLYSGGGYTLLQLIMEDVTGRQFDQYMRERVFVPLGMTDSAY
jgi:CubicO group peptidase (beta-lactamase class C family)